MRKGAKLGGETLKAAKSSRVRVRDPCRVVRDEMQNSQLIEQRQKSGSRGQKIQGEQTKIDTRFRKLRGKVRITGWSVFCAGSGEGDHLAQSEEDQEQLKLIRLITGA